MIKVVCNASPIIGLSMLGLLNLLCDMFEVYIPEKVYNEIVLAKEGWATGKNKLIESVKKGQIKIYKVKDQDLINKLYGRLHRGELETIVAAKEMNLTYVIIDEKSARGLAKTFFLRPIGILGVLQGAKELNKIDELKPYLDTLRNNGFRISNKLYYDLLKKVDE